METEKGGFKRVLDSFHQTLKKNCRNIHRSVWQLLGVAKIQNGGRCHGNQGAKHVKFTPDSNNFAVMFPVTSTFSGTR